MFRLIILCFVTINCDVLKASLMITNNPMNVTVCSGANAIVSCGFTGANPSSTLPNWSWKIIKRNNDGDVISNETVRVLDINDNNTDGLTFFFVTTTMNGIRNANNSYLSVGPVDDTYNNTSYQCIFTINDSIIESETAGTVIVADVPSSPVLTYESTLNEILVSWSPVDSDTVCGPVTYNITVMPSHGIIMMINDTVYNITGLNYNTNYTITVYATNNAGDGGHTMLTVETKPLPRDQQPTEGITTTTNMKALVITNGPMNVTVCSGSVAEISCDFTGAPDPFNTRPDWRIIKRSNDGHVISNETVNQAIIRINKTNGLVFRREVLINNSVIGRLSVGPVDDTYNNTSYQCIFTINDTIIESDTAATVTVIDALSSPMLTYERTLNDILVSWSPVDSHTVCGPVTYNITVMPSHGMIMMINDTVYNITGLNYNTNYTITVYATNNHTRGEPATVTVKTEPVIINPSGPIQGTIVGTPQVINCTVSAVSGVDASSVIISWMGPGGAITIDSRVTISPTTSSGNTYTSSLQFTYLMEGDEGTYTCNVMILETNGSQSVELLPLVVPTPTVSVTALNTQIVGQSVTLQCKVSIVRGITSRVDILWSSDGIELERMNNVPSSTINNSLVYTDYYTISQLSTTDDDRVIQCEGVINANTPVMANDSINLGVTVPMATITVYPFDPIQGAMVGSPQVINCIVSTVSGVESSSVMISWMGPGGVITSDNRVTVSLTSSGNTYTSSLQFTYLMEGDEGTYTCNVMILETNGSQSVELQSLAGDNGDDINSDGASDNGSSSSDNSKSDNSKSDTNKILLLAAIVAGVIVILVVIIVIMVCVIVCLRKKANHYDKGTLQRRPLVGSSTFTSSASSTFTSFASPANNTLTSSVCDKYEKQKEHIALLDYATIDNKVNQSIEHNSDYDKLNERDSNTEQTTSTTVEYAVVDKSKKKKASQEEQKPFADYDYPPVHIQYSCEKEVPQGEHNPFADYDYPPVVNKVAPVNYAELQDLPISGQTYSVDKDITTMYSQVV